MGKLVDPDHVNRSRHRLIRSSLFALLLVPAACSGTERAAEPDGSATSVDSTAVAESVSAEAGDTVAGSGSSTEVLSAAEASRAAAEANAGRQVGGEEFGLTMEQLAERSDAVEESIGVCMSEAGFEYFPVDFGEIRRAMTSDKSAPGLSNSEFIEQYGFGITTQFDKPMVELSLGEQNRRIVDNLGEADRVAYLRTLYGENTDATYAAGLETENLSRTGGCTRTAIEAHFSPEELSASYFNPGDALIETDPRAQEAIAAWYDCMVDGGVDGYLHPGDVEIGFQRRLDALTTGRDPEDLAGDELAALTQLQNEELEVAGVFTRCEANVLDPAMERVEDEYFGR
ncbi:MAG: hypothetical protein OES24_18240 [Acidimicrobiia bacterium]|nr:hypothetical protein [Acidimicrobiia bacterium]